MLDIDSVFYNHRKLKKPSTLYHRPDSINEAYRIQRVNRNKLGDILAWKLGGSTLTTRQIFNTDSIYFGPIFANNVTFSDNKLKSLPIYNLLRYGEAEIAFRLSNQINLLDEPSLMRDPNLLVDAIYPAVELPCAPFPLPDAGLEVLIADMCASGHLILGQAISLPNEMRALWMIVSYM